jgi:HK97 family phage prohead protease
LPPTPAKAMETKDLRKTFGCQIKAVDEPEGILEAIVNVFNIVDRTDERTMPGMAERSIAKKMPRGVWHHRWAEPIAKTLDARELKPGDPLLPEDLKEFGGLYIRGQFFKEITDSWQAFLKILNGLIDEFSIGYRVVKSMYNSDEEVWELHEIEWFEWSPVLVGANQATAVLSAKSLSSEEGAKQLLSDPDIRKQFLEGQLKMTLDEHSSLSLDVSEGLIARLERMKADGLTISTAVTDRVKSHLARLESAIAPAPSQTQDPDEQKRLRCEIDREFLKTMRRCAGV